MSRKLVVPSVTVEPSKSLASAFTSTPTVINNSDNITYQIDVNTVDSTGTFSVQSSVDYVQASPNQAGNPGSWVDLSLGGGIPTVAAANDTILIALVQAPGSALRIAYTPTVAGTGTCAIRISTKTVGA